MTHEEVDKVEEDLRKVERELEEIGARICSAENGADSWNEINRAVEHVGGAIHSAFKMRPE